MICWDVEMWKSDLEMQAFKAYFKAFVDLGHTHTLFVIICLQFLENWLQA